MKKFGMKKFGKIAFLAAGVALLAVALSSITRAFRFGTRSTVCSGECQDTEYPTRHARLRRIHLEHLHGLETSRR
jgi:hypothetical protein